MNTYRRLALVGACVVLPTTALGQNVGGPPDDTIVPKQLPIGTGGSIDASSGAYTESIPIQMPKFRGLEPALSLDYVSSGRNGQFGLGWRLTGHSYVERSGPRGGAPRFDGGDIFELDGEELVPFTEFGTHALRIKRYLRIRRSGNTWSVTSGDGVTSSYGFVFAGGYRTYLSRVQDTNGNVINYGYWCDGASDCYLDTITYGATQARFLRERRPDVIIVGRGRALTTTRFRVREIQISVAGQRVRSYRLTYGSSGTTQKSVLSRVQMFGRDGASALPAWRFTYAPSGTIGYGPVTSQVLTPTLRQHANDGGLQLMDMNGDGRTDMVRHHYIEGLTANRRNLSVWVMLGQTNGRFGAPIYSMVTKPEGNDPVILVPNAPVFDDFNGDGRIDILLRSNHGFTGRDPLHTRIAFGQPNGRFINAPQTHAFNGIQKQLFGGDFNGDGRSDIFRYRVYNGNLQYWIGLSSGNGSFTERTGTINVPSGGIRYNADAIRRDRATGAKLADIDGDGATDIFTFGFGSPTNVVRTQIALSNRAGGFLAARHTTTTMPTVFDRAGGVRLGDINGDGRADMVRTCWAGIRTLLCAGPANSIQVAVAMSKGDGSFGAPIHSTLASGFSGIVGHRAGWARQDIDGDGTSDFTLRRVWAGVSNWELRHFVSLGNGRFAATPMRRFNHPAASEAYSHGSHNFAPDVDGDGNADYVAAFRVPHRTGTVERLETHIYLSRGGDEGLLKRAVTPLGATTDVHYLPASRWANTDPLPRFMTAVTAVTNDGLNNVALTQFAYAGGRYHRAQRRFLGFRSVSRVRPCNPGESACPVTTTVFRQDHGSVGKPARIDDKNGAGRLLKRVAHAYTTNGATRPHTSLNTRTVETLYDGAARALTTERTFDRYGNVIRERQLGAAGAADDRTIRTDFFPNTTAFITNRPGLSALYAGTTIASAPLTMTLFNYDRSVLHTTPPSRGLLTRKLDFLDTKGPYAASDYAITNYEFDRFGNQTGVTTFVDNESPINTTTTYDTTHNLYPTRTVNALGQASTSRWDPVCGTLLESTDANQQTTTRTYDQLCRLRRVDQPLGGYERYTYLSLGKPNEQTIRIERPPPNGVAGDIWLYRYFDGLGRTYQTVSRGAGALRVRTETQHTPRGQVLSQTGSFYEGETPHRTSTKYDALDRPTTVTLPDGKTIRTTYGTGLAFGSQTTIDELGHRVVVHVDAHGRTVARDEFVGTTARRARYQYNLRDQLVRITDPAGNVWTNEWDSLGRVLRSVDPDRGAERSHYDHLGRVRRTTDALGQHTDFTYDQLGRTVQKTTRAGTSRAETSRWIFDEPRSGYANVGRLTTMIDAHGKETYNYDGRGRQVWRARTVGDVIFPFQVAHDRSDRVLHSTYPDGSRVGSVADQLGYDEAGRLESIPGLVTDIVYDAKGRITDQLNENGTVTSRVFDEARGWLDSIRTTQGRTTIQNLVYGRDAEGKVTSITSPFPLEGWTFGHDTRHRLTRATSASNAGYSHSVAYDAIGNITRHSLVGTYSYPRPGAARPHAVTRAGSQTYGYDAAGNMTARNGKAITYDGENRPITLGSAKFSYDGNGQRIEKLADGVSTVYLGGGVETRNCRMTKYLSAGLSTVKITPDETQWLHADHAGSINAMTNERGVVVKRRAHLPYGDVATTDSGPEERLGFTGAQQDESGLVYLNARYYDPAIGRFITPDLIQPDGLVGLNRYAYAANDPINFVDLDGLQSRRLSGGIQPIGRLQGAVMTARAWYLEVTGLRVIGDLTGIAAYRTPFELSAANKDRAFAGGLALGGGTPLKFSRLPRARGERIGNGLEGRTTRPSSSLSSRLEVGGGNAVDFSGDLGYGLFQEPGNLRAFIEATGARPFTRGVVEPLATSMGERSQIIWLSKRLLNGQRVSGGRIHFDLTGIEDIPNILRKAGPRADNITSHELRFLRGNWPKFRDNTVFWRQEGKRWRQVPPSEIGFEKAR